MRQCVSGWSFCDVVCCVVQVVFTIHMLLLLHGRTGAVSDAGCGLTLCSVVLCCVVQVVFTIHNMNYGQKKIAEAAEWCQKFTTVSPTYAFEVGDHPAIAGASCFWHLR